MDDGETKGLNSSASPRRSRRDVIVAFGCGVFVAAMVGAAYAAVPLYNWFCRTTGFGGTTQVASAAPGQVLQRTLTVRFDGNVSGGLPWRFEPETRTVTVRIGEPHTVYYKVTNEAARETVGQASYNVTPPTVGAYFSKTAQSSQNVVAPWSIISPHLSRITSMTSLCRLAFAIASRMNA
jgi:cytochrome c oxidase assembly protein subunit 11